MLVNIHRQAFSALINRYSEAFRLAWRHRAEMAPLKRLPHEAQFLPAALAVQETPVSPAPRIAIWLLIAFAALALLWSLFGRIDVVATAQGKIVANDRSKTIQPFETASVKAIHVTDGQTVEAGDILIELDPTTARADQDRIRNDLFGFRLRSLRGKAMLTAIASGKKPKLARPADIRPADEPKFQEAQHLSEAQYGEFTAKTARIDAEVARHIAELRSTQELVNKLEQTAPIARQRAEDYKHLADRHFVSRHGYLEQEQIRIEQEADLANQKSRRQEIAAALQAARTQRIELAAEIRRLTLDSIIEGQQKAEALEQDMLKADQRGKLMQIISPVAGTVQQLAAHTIGGVVTPAQPLMVIVPAGNALEIEAFIENKDIGFVKPDQDAEVKVETFQYTKYGTLHAKITSISHDAINDEKRGLIYSTRVKLDRSTIDVDGTEVNLSPGMAVSVEIKTGTRRVIEYFLSPLLQYGHESLGER